MYCAEIVQQSFDKEDVEGCNKLACCVTFDICHSRIGYISEGKMKLVSNVGSLLNKSKEFIYDAWPKAKQRRLSFPISHISTTCVFELIHVDTWGPYHIKHMEGKDIF